MAEIKNYNQLACCHQNGKIIKMFTTPKESIKFADIFEKKYNIKLSCDPLYVVIHRNKINGEIKGWQDCKYSR